MSDPLTVGPNNAGTLAQPYRRIRIGIDEEDAGGARQWELWIPSAGGGEVTITHSGGAKLGLITTSGEILGHGEKTITTVLPAGQRYGWFYVTTLGPAGTLRCNYKQTGWARVGASEKADPLIPYNFYFYPFRSGPRGAQDPLINTIRRYAATSEEIPDNCEKWEDTHHAMPPGQQYSGFEGHCHNAAAASVYFELPAKTTEVAAPLFKPNETFNREEMKILGTEFFGSYGNVKLVWQMPGWVTDPQKPELTQGDGSVLSYLIPAEPKTKKALLDAMTTVFGADLAEKRVDEFLAKIGGEQNLEAETTYLFGNAAATFFNTLVTQLLGEGHPLLGNMRTFDIITPQARGIWNHALFHYSAEFAETPGTDDKMDMTIQCTISGNVDAAPPYKNDLPAEIRDGVVVPSTDPDVCRQWRHKWRIAFSARGIPEANRNNRWESCRGIQYSAVTTELYAPMDLRVIRQSAVLSSSRDKTREKLNARQQKVPDRITWGNPAVHDELVERGYMKIRDRYK